MIVVREGNRIWLFHSHDRREIFKAIATIISYFIIIRTVVRWEILLNGLVNHSDLVETFTFSHRLAKKVFLLLNSAGLICHLLLLHHADRGLIDMGAHLGEPTRDDTGLVLDHGRRCRGLLQCRLLFYSRVVDKGVDRHA